VVCNTFSFLEAHSDQPADIISRALDTKLHEHKDLSGPLLEECLRCIDNYTAKIELLAPPNADADNDDSQGSLDMINLSRVLMIRVSHLSQFRFKTHPDIRSISVS